jgi:hypothetical protein
MFMMVVVMNTKWFFDRFHEHGSCDGASRSVEAFCATKLL